MTRFNWTYLYKQNKTLKQTKTYSWFNYLNSFIAPSHNLSSADVSNWRWHLTPLQNEVLWNTTHRIDIHAFVVVTQKKIHAVWIRQGDDAMWRYWSLSLIKEGEDVKTPIRIAQVIKTYMFWQINIINSRWVQINSVEAISRSINDFQSSLLLNSQVNQQWTMIQFAKTLLSGEVKDVRFECCDL